MISFDIKKVKVVPITEVRANSWNPKEKNTKEYRKIVESIKKDGVKSPVIVRESDDGTTKYEIIDGEQRYTALNELKSKDIIIYNSGEVSDIDAKNETLWWQLQVPFDNIKLVPLVTELMMAEIEMPFEVGFIQELTDIDNLNLEDLLKPQDDDFLNGAKTLKLSMPEDAFDIIMDAIKKVQKENDNISESRALELICADYLSGSV